MANKRLHKMKLADDPIVCIVDVKNLLSMPS